MDSTLHPAIDVSARPTTIASSAPVGSARRPVRVVPWLDPVVDRRGHDPRSTYVERFWLGTLGPTATFLMRRLAAGFDDHPDGYDLDLRADRAVDRPEPQPRPVEPVRQGVRPLRDVRARPRAPRRLRRPATPPRGRPASPDPDARRGAGRAPALGRRLRAPRLAAPRPHAGAAMLAVGDDAELIEPQLVALGLSAPTAAQVCELVRAEQRPARCQADLTRAFSRRATPERPVRNDSLAARPMTSGARASATGRRGLAAGDHGVDERLPLALEARRRSGRGTTRTSARRV